MLASEVFLLQSQLFSSKMLLFAPDELETCSFTSLSNDKEELIGDGVDGFNFLLVFRSRWRIFR